MKMNTRRIIASILLIAVGLTALGGNFFYFSPLLKQVERSLAGMADKRSVDARFANTCLDHISGLHEHIVEAYYVLGGCLTLVGICLVMIFLGKRKKTNNAINTDQ